MRANVYVDGFNLYYGALKGTHIKWLDIGALCGLLLKGDTVNRIRYFTARIQPDPRDPDKGTRQQLYLRALRTTPGLTIHYGHYLSHNVRLALTTPVPGQPRTVEVIKTEEKVVVEPTEHPPCRPPVKPLGRLLRSQDRHGPSGDGRPSHPGLTALGRGRNVAEGFWFQ